MDYIQTDNYWGNSYWGGGYWGAIGKKHAEVFRVNLVMNRMVESVGVMALAVPATQVMNLTVAESVIMSLNVLVNGILNKIVSDRYDELEEL